MAIHPTAVVAPEAKLASDVEIGPFCLVHPNVELGSGARISAYCELGLPTPLAQGRPLVIGARSQIRSHSVFYEGATIGDDLRTGHGVMVREGAAIGQDTQLGSNCDVQGDCTLGDHFRSQSNVFIAKGSRIGRYVWLLPYVILTNDPHPPSHVTRGCEIEDFAVVAANCVVMPGVRIGTHALIGACSRVNRDVPARTLAAGNPLRLIGEAGGVTLKDGTDRPAYPWPRHFRRGYADYADFDAGGSET